MKFTMPASSIANQTVGAAIPDLISCVIQVTGLNLKFQVKQQCL